MSEAVPLRPLPTSVEELLTELRASPRLVAHLRAVHDIGRVLQLNELSSPGSSNEPAGHGPPQERGMTERLATSRGQEAWEVFMALDDELDRIASGADAQPTFQSNCSVAV